MLSARSRRSCIRSTAISDPKPAFFNAAIIRRPIWPHPTTATLSPNFGDDQTVFVATSDGVFRSVDRGDNWIEMNVNLATRSILLIRPSPHYSVDRTVYAVTSGGELWRCSVSASTGSG